MSDLTELNSFLVVELLGCDKVICSNPSPRDKSNSLHRETGMECESNDGRFRFQVFIREHTELVEHFSIGLIYVPEVGKPIVLTRYNGNHGLHKNFLTGEILEDCCHIHEFREELKSLGVSIDNHAYCTDKYNSLEEAKKSFFNDLKFNNYLDFYPELMQDTLGI